MVRVLLLSDVYFPRVNGVSTSIRTFRDDLPAAGVTSVLLAPNYPGETHESESDIVRVASSGVPRDPEDRRMHLGALRRALAGLRSEPFDLVHIHTPFLAHYAGVRFARAAGIPAVATYHTFFEEYLHHYVPLLPRALGRMLARRFTRSQCAQVQALIAPSEPMRELLANYGVSTPIRVIPTGLPADRFVAGEGQRFRDRFGIARKRPLLLYVGRVAHEKNIGFLLRAFVELRRTRRDALLVIAGEGPARESLMSQAAELGLGADVTFVGYLDREQGLADCYAAADVFVFASRTETQGLVLLEALAQGRPVVSTAHLGTASILVAGCGARVAPEEPAAFARLVEDILEDPKRAAQLSEQARRYAATWSSALMATRLAELYREVVSTHVPAQAAGPATASQHVPSPGSGS
jgi:glycosyltransferase involved in cell wall biosynthesis